MAKGLFNYTEDGVFDRLVSNIKSRLAKIAFTGKVSDADNDMEFKTVKEMTVEEFEALPEGKDEEEVIYFIKDAVPPDSPLITEERIEGIESDLTELGAEVAGNTQDISALNSTVAQHGTDISALETTTAQHGTDIAALESGKADVDGIVLTGDVTGTSAFNAESGKTEISAQRRGCLVYSSPSHVGWFNVAFIEVVKEYQDYSITFLVEHTYMVNTAFAILRLMIRMEPAGQNKYQKLILEYASSDFNPENFVLTCNENSSGKVEYRLWIEKDIIYQGTSFTVLSEEFNEVRETNLFTLYNNPPAVSEIPSDYTQVPATLATIQNPIISQAYTTFSEIFDDSPSEFIDSTFGNFNLVSSGKNKTLYMYFRVLKKPSSDNYNHVAHLKKEFVPSINYASGSVRSSSSAEYHKEIGTIWLGADRNVTLYISSEVVYPVLAYTYLTWITA